MKLIPLLILFEISLIMASDTDWRRKILVTNKETPEEGLKILREKCDLIFPESVPATRDEILKLIPGVDGILWVGHYALNGEVLDLGMPTLKSISTMSAGMDYVDIAEFKRRNFPLGYTPSVLSDAVADEAIGLMIAAGRRFHEGRLKIENSEWAGGPQWMLGQDIKAKTIGIIGLGQIGQTIAKRLKGFDVRRILYSGRKPKPEGDKLGAKFVPQTELLKGSDYVFLSVPLNNSTRHMINATTLREMKRTAVLINVARGEIVDQEALVAALKDGTIFAAGLDVMTPEPLPADSELLKLPNSVIVSHLGSATRRTRDDMAVLAALNVLAGIDGSPMFAPYPY
ncbi:glyoxylate reductase/hydroxypyruvate reductase-like isoform X1 [Toxorhynchites rutilus septentrionalis]|uniref:glyoxylate reductase/hydroxypyruvate reductase-like isoform X1 n=1 Tax=Toxorhynchites rutilus septentrionalis TaxID=329112 RepID=UPI002479F146|nr:glyoxylate reductase/hydroxypyruvate reductase-like isoform X1 [Toxorhynchites rutilus septentrionalis]XP_055641809.1 glyoxylate reductase/hydroxypyruvate reductase-like isoform X1 [Toxorhynchites rutilus septentrionalis]XP_055641810.1 glyoxylate reductase/hydroxypyruvate reductase-like isoform X1 [Toxorhynchites rutilus septentrionalis]XP_055641811.1 glyoxylate reductase/hydroxypyruvate reductase-like isoform X1 [Toxorhynchites rutilus septentrionalis]XP_055641812.1 glyoxylate reductase/hyd